MATSKAKTVTEYLASLPRDRRDELEAVRALIRKHLPTGYEEGMLYGMICWFAPLSRTGKTYNGQPLGTAALAAQKNYNALYLLGAYANPTGPARLQAECEAAGKKLDMGKSCLRFDTADDLPLKAIGELIAETTVDELIAQHAKAHDGRKKAAKTAKAGVRKTKRAKPKAPKK